jgi:hypothetical protein
VPSGWGLSLSECSPCSRQQRAEATNTRRQTTLASSLEVTIRVRSWVKRVRATGGDRGFGGALAFSLRSPRYLLQFSACYTLTKT